MDLLWKRDGIVHDLVFVNGDCPVTNGRSDSVAQRIYLRLRTFRGEWFLSENYGVPWLERILGHKVKKTTVDMVIINEIMSVKGVKKILSFESTFDNSVRDYSCKFTVVADDGFEENIII